MSGLGQPLIPLSHLLFAIMASLTVNVLKTKIGPELGPEWPSMSKEEECSTPRDCLYSTMIQMDWQTRGKNRMARESQILK